MPISTEEIDDYFAKLDWPFVKREPTLWESGYSGQNFRVRFVVRLTERWLYINALLPVKVRPECRNNLFEHLLRLNFMLNGVKLYLDKDDEVTLAMELLTGEVPLATFEAALYAVCSNADAQFVELIKLATEPAAISSQKPLRPPPANGSAALDGPAR